MRAATMIALAALLVLAFASEVMAQSRRQRAAQRSVAPPAQFQQRTPTTNPNVKPFTAEEAGWFARASRNY
jgi:hypothetical protein